MNKNKKFTYLNKYVINEIIEFLEFHEIFQTIRFLNRLLYKFYKQQKIIKHLINNLQKNILEIDFSLNKIDIIIKEYFQLNLNCKYLYNIFGLILALKYKNESILEIRFKEDFVFEVFRNFLQLKNNFIELYFNDNKMDLNDVKYFCKSLNLLQNLEKIDLSENNLGINEINIKYLSFSLSKLSNLKYINLSSNKLGRNTNNIRYISESISKLPNMKIINLYNNELGKDKNNMKFLNEGLLNPEKIIKIDLSKNHLGFEFQLEFLSKFLSKIMNCKKIDLSFNFIGLKNTDMKFLKKGLLKITELRKIDLSHNFFMDKKMIKDLSNCLEKIPQLNTIKLNNNGLGNYENNLRELGIVLPKLKNLKKIELRGNNLDEYKNMDHICNGVSDLNLDLIDISENELDEDNYGVIYLKICFEGKNVIE